jgi:hypothetical protein
MHVTMDLLNGHINYLQIAPDKESERLYQPFANELNDTLVLEDAGYFDIHYCHQIAQAGGHHIIRTSNAINPNILDSFDEQGRVTVHQEPIDLRYPIQKGLGNLSFQ